MNAAQLQQMTQKALALQHAGKPQAAATAFAQIRRIAPQNFDAWLLGGNIALLAGNPEEAAKLYAQALQLNPRSAAAATCLGVARLALGDLAGAELHQQRALRLEPKNAGIWSQLATVLNKQGRFDEAIKAHRQAVTLDPKSAPAWHGYGITLSNMNLVAEALECEQRALAANPAYTAARHGYAVALQKCHRVPEALREYEILLQQNPRELEIQSHRLFALNYVHGVSAEALFAAHRAYGELLNNEERRGPFPNSPDADRKLRVAFFSADFREHSVAYFLEPLLKFTNREQFEILLYSFCPKPDVMTARFRALASVWREFPSHLANVVEPLVRADAPDIVVDLGGHTGNSLLPLFARRLAPVQISYLGYPNTTGISAMDYRLVDAITDPEPTADLLATEKLLRFAPTAWCYAAPERSPEPTPPPCIARGYITFGSFNNFSKVTDEMLQLWARLLNAVPGSQLLLKSTGFNDPAIIAQLRSRFTQAGLANEHVALAPMTNTTEEHLASYANVDIALDTAPYNGTTTTCEALWMGVPVVTLMGDRHAARVGASLLQSVGHSEWIAANADEYVSIAENLTRDVQQLTDWRTPLRTDMKNSSLMDHPTQAERFSSVLREGWRNWCIANNTAPV